MRRLVRSFVPVITFGIMTTPALAQMQFGTYLGGTGNDYVHHVLTDASGNVYVTGRTMAPDFPTTPGAYSTTFSGGDHDVFVAKLDPTGSSLIWSTYLGGSGDDQPAMLAIEPGGTVLVIGTTSSADFPVTGDALQGSNGGDYDVFLTRLSADGSAVAYSSYLGGVGKETVAGLLLDPAGDILVAGTTASANFPTTAGAYQTSYGGGSADYGDMFAARLTSGGASLVWSTFLGGAHDDECRALGMDGSGDLYVAGWTARIPGEPGPDFPTTAGAYDTTYAGDRDAALARLSADGSALVYGTFLGGADKDQANSLFVAGDGTAWVVGDTASSAFPTTPGAFQTAYGGVRDVFVTKVSPDGSSLVWSTFLGGSAEEGFGTVGLTPGGDVVIGGYTLSSDFPITPGAFQPLLAGQSDAFVAKLTSDGASLGYATFLGGSLTDRGGAGLDPWGNALLVGFTASPDFPVTPGAFQTSVGAGWAGYVAKLGLAKQPTKVYVLNRAGAIGRLVYLRGYLFLLDNTPVAGKTLSFTVDGTPVAVETTNGDGRATHSYVIPEADGAGARAIAVTFAGDAPLHPSGGGATLTVSKGSLNVWVLSRSVAQGGLAYLRAYLRRLPDLAWLEGRLVTVDVDGTDIGSATTDASGRASVLYACPSGFPLGSHSIGAQFAGDAAFLPASGAGVLTVVP